MVEKKSCSCFASRDALFSVPRRDFTEIRRVFCVDHCRFSSSLTKRSVHSSGYESSWQLWPPNDTRFFDSQLIYIFLPPVHAPLFIWHVVPGAYFYDVELTIRIINCPNHRWWRMAVFYFLSRCRNHLRGESLHIGSSRKIRCDKAQDCDAE